MDAIQKNHYADDDTLARLLKLERELAEAHMECEEQARLNGMGSEREAKLMAERDRAVRYAEARDRVLRFIAAYDFNAPYCCGWKDSARDFQRWACEALGVVKGPDLEGYAAVEAELLATNGLPTIEGEDRNA